MRGFGLGLPRLLSAAGPQVELQRLGPAPRPSSGPRRPEQWPLLFATSASVSQRALTCSRSPHLFRLVLSFLLAFSLIILSFSLSHSLALSRHLSLLLVLLFPVSLHPTLSLIPCLTHVTLPHSLSLPSPFSFFLSLSFSLSLSLHFPTPPSQPAEA